MMSAITNAPVALSYIPTIKIVPVVQCQFCCQWKADADGLFGVCASEGFAEKVFAERDEGSPIMTSHDFHEPEFFEAVG